MNEPTVCSDFEWVGQSPKTCDGCGLPFWEHTHYRNSELSSFERESVKNKWT